MHKLPLVALVSFAFACGGGSGPGLGLDAAPDQPDAVVADPDAGPEAPDPDAGVDPWTPPLERGHAGGMPSVLEVRGERAYLGVGPRLAVWSLANSGAPALLGESPPLPGLIGGVAVFGNTVLATAWAGSDGRLLAIDVSDPTAPTVVRAIRVGTGPTARPLALAEVDGRLFLADPYQGLFELEVSDPTAPVVVAQHPDITVSQLRRSERRLYGQVTVLGGVSVRAYDLDHDLAPLGSVLAGGATSAAIGAGHLLVYARTDAVYVRDLTDLSAPVERFSATVPGADAVVAGAGVAYVNGSAGLFRIDLTGSGTDALVGPWPRATGRLVDGRVTDTLLVQVSERGSLWVEARQAPTGQPPVSVTRISAASRPQAVSVAGLTSVVVELGSRSTGGLTALGLADLGGRGQIGFDAGASPRDVAVADDIAYVADAVSGLRMVDISDADAPVALALAAAPAGATSVELDGDRLYVGSPASAGGWLWVFDRSQPDAPVELGVAAVGSARDLAVIGNLVLVADDRLPTGGGLSIYDATDPRAMAQVGSYGACAAVTAVAAAGSRAALVCTNEGVHLIDLTDPAAPVQLHVWPRTGDVMVTQVAIDDQRVYLGTTRGVQVYAFEAPATALAVWATAAAVTRVTVPYEGRVVATAGTAGIYQWALESSK